MVWVWNGPFCYGTFLRLSGMAFFVNTSCSCRKHRRAAAERWKWRQPWKVPKMVTDVVSLKQILLTWELLTQTMWPSIRILQRRRLVDSPFSTPANNMNKHEHQRLINDMLILQRKLMVSARSQSHFWGQQTTAKKKGLKKCVFYTQTTSSHRHGAKITRDPSIFCLVSKPTVNQIRLKNSTVTGSEHALFKCRSIGTKVKSSKPGRDLRCKQQQGDKDLVPMATPVFLRRSITFIYISKIRMVMIKSLYDGIMFILYYSILHPQSLTVRPWKMNGTGRLSPFLLVPGFHFSGENSLLNFGRVFSFLG